MAATATESNSRAVDSWREPPVRPVLVGCICSGSQKIEGPDMGSRPCRRGMDPGLWSRPSRTVTVGEAADRSPGRDIRTGDLMSLARTRLIGGALAAAVLAATMV